MGVLESILISVFYLISNFNGVVNFLTLFFSYLFFGFLALVDLLRYLSILDLSRFNLDLKFYWHFQQVPLAFNGCMCFYFMQYNSSFLLPLFVTHLLQTPLAS